MRLHTHQNSADFANFSIDTRYWVQGWNRVDTLMRRRFGGGVWADFRPSRGRSKVDRGPISGAPATPSERKAQLTVAAAFASRVAVPAIAFGIAGPEAQQASLHGIKAVMLLSNFGAAAVGELLRGSAPSRIGSGSAPERPRLHPNSTPTSTPKRHTKPTPSRRPVGAKWTPKRHQNDAKHDAKSARNRPLNLP